MQVKETTLLILSIWTFLLHLASRSIIQFPAWPQICLCGIELEPPGFDKQLVSTWGRFSFHSQLPGKLWFFFLWRNAYSSFIKHGWKNLTNFTCFSDALCSFYTLYFQLPPWRCLVSFMEAWRAQNPHQIRWDSNTSQRETLWFKAISPARSAYIKKGYMRRASYVISIS